MPEPSFLSVKGVETFYGAIQALHGVDLEVARGEIVTLIGASVAASLAFPERRPHGGEIAGDESKPPVS
jgi:ABC-type transporter Mla maintaining outer membrane lipid asymmetry ATPase subunit MlaF